LYIGLHSPAGWGGYACIPVYRQAPPEDGEFPCMASIRKKTFWETAKTGVKALASLRKAWMENAEKCHIRALLE
jgi:hypothetical protein